MRRDSHNSELWPARLRLVTWRTEAKRLIGVLAAMIALAVTAAQVGAQTPPRLWAAQTEPNQVSGAWDSVPGAAEYRLITLVAVSVDLLEVFCE